MKNGFACFTWRLAAALSLLLLLSCTTILTDRRTLGLGEKSIILTFDDGPGERREIDDALLDVLSEKGVTAWFCLIGSKLAGNEATVRRIVAEGHEIAFHSWDHWPWIGTDIAAVKRDIEKFDAAMTEILGYPFLVRGLRPAMGIMSPELQSRLLTEGYVIVRVTHFPRDTFVNTKGSSAYMKELVSGMEKAGGGMIVLHNGVELFPQPSRQDYYRQESPADREWLPGEVGSLIDHFRNLSYTFLPAGGK